MIPQMMLKPEQINAINAARRVLNDLIQVFDCAEDSGVPCADLRKKKDEMMEGFDKIIKHFGGQL